MMLQLALRTISLGVHGSAVNNFDLTGMDFGKIFWVTDIMLNYFNEWQYQRWKPKYEYRKLTLLAAYSTPIYYYTV